MDNARSLTYVTYQRLITPLLFTSLLLYGTRNAFIQDDAYITFRYAYNLIYNNSITWNAADMQRIEGYTNFLWTLLMALPMAMGYDPVRMSMLFGLCCGFGTLLITYYLALDLFGSIGYARLALLLLGTNYTFSCYMTGGLETQLQTLLILASVYICMHILSGRISLKSNNAMLLSILFALAILTRLDSCLPCLTIYVSLVVYVIVHKRPFRESLCFFLNLSVPAAIIIGAWFLWKYYYYGEILPNSYYLKASIFSFRILLNGMAYVAVFLYYYSLIPFVILIVMNHEHFLMRWELCILIIISSLWFLYIAKVGGDFMEFRFMVPILPILYILIVKIIIILQNIKVQIALVGMLLISALVFPIVFSIFNGIESIGSLNNHTIDSGDKWARIGCKLNEIFSDCQMPITIATTAAGAIPYYSRLRAVDMLGVNDRWIARNGAIVGDRPGHQRAATLEYLIEQRVNIVIGHPNLTSNDDISYGDRWYQMPPTTFNGIERQSIPCGYTFTVLKLPIDDRKYLTVLYLNKHPYIDDLIKKLEIKRCEIRWGVY